MSDDVVSRQAAIEHLKKRLYETALNSITEHPYYEELADNRVDVWLNELQSAERRGKWIAVENDVDYYPFMCSECYETVTKKTNYCPRCGSRMNMEDKNE